MVNSARVTMLIGSIVIVTLASAALVAADGCHTDRPIVNDDFEIPCSKSGYLEVEIICKTTQPWSNFPSDRLNLRSVKTTIFRNCNFPDGLSLFNITSYLGLGSIDTLKFVNSQTLVKREHLKGFAVSTLHFYNNNFNNDLPKDLLYDIDIKELIFDNTELKIIPADFFKYSAKLRNLEIINNELQRLRRNDLAPLENLKDLLLFANKIEDIESGSFDKLINLRVLDFSRNYLKSLPSDLFHKLVKLERLNMSENDFEELPTDLLQIEDSRLQRVRLNHNRGKLTSLPDEFFKNLRSLNYAELTSNNFTSIPANVFIGANSLMALNVSNNSLVDLPSKIFKSTYSLRELWLSENLLESLPEGIFEDVNLERLYLDYNRLTELSSGVLSGLDNLKILQVSHNNLTYIDYEAYKHVKEVQYIDLSHNNLTLANPNIPAHSVFVNCVAIIDMNLSYNRISEMFQDWHYNGNLKNLDLEGNEFTYITVADLNMLKHDTQVNLRNNKISTIDLTGLEDYVKEYRAINVEEPNKNVVVYLDNNPLNCDCKLLYLTRYFEHRLTDEVYSFVKLTADELKCASPDQLKNRTLSNIRSEQLRCLIKSNVTTDPCSENCTCWEYPGKEVLSIDCSERNLTTAPSYVINPRNWSIELNLSGNRLRNTPSLNRTYLVNVTALDLSRNNISTVSLDVFSRSLRDLKLHNNSISRLDTKVVEYLGDDTTLKNLTLHDNNWICDCEARNFLSVVQKKLTAYELHEVTCRGSNRRLSSITVNELCEGAVAIIVVASLLIAVFGIVLGLLAALYYRYQKEIKVWLYSKQWCLWFVTEDELDRDKKYDAFISFSHKDEDFVDKEIVAKLEDGPKPYKLCLHYRDWLAGEWIPAQIARSVDESRRTIVVLSPNFLESVWGRMEFRTAHSQALSEGRARVIVILYGDIGNTEDLDPELKAYLSMNTYVKWGDPWFWDKLRYALPHRYESSRRRTRTARIIENHLNQLPVNSHATDNKAEIIPMPKITPATNDSAKLLDSGNEDDRVIAAC